MPYRVDLVTAGPDTLDRLIELGAFDAETTGEGLAALLPDSVPPQQVAAALGLTDVEDLSIAPAIGRDADSVWVLSPPLIHIGRHSMRLTDSAAFGTGLHPTTALCLEALADIIEQTAPETVLDVGTGSGVLAIAALQLSVPRALGIDIDERAVLAAAENARLNGLADRLTVLRGGPEIATGMWPMVLANVLAAPLIEMAPAIVRRLGHRGQLVLSGIPAAVEPDVDRVYRRLGLRHLRTATRGGWVALVMQASW